MSRDEGHDFLKWLGKFPMHLGIWGALAFVISFFAICVGVYKSFYSADSGIAIVALGVGLTALGIGVISIGAAYKSNTAVKTVGDSDVKMDEECKTEAGVGSLKGDVPEKGALGSDVDEIKIDSKDVKDIIERLDRIENRQDEYRKGNEKQFWIGFGFTCVVVGSTWVTTTHLGNLYGWGLILIGIMIVLGAFGVIRKRSRKNGGLSGIKK